MTTGEWCVIIEALENLAVDYDEYELDNDYIYDIIDKIRRNEI